MNVAQVLDDKGVYSKASITIIIQALAHCCVLSQIFTACYALNAHDLIKGSSLPKKNCQQVQCCF